MTKMESLNENYENQSHKIIEDCDEAKKKLAELGFCDTVRGEVFKTVFDNYWSYQINEIKLMSVDMWEMSKYHRMQYLIQFEDDSQMFIYMEVK